MTGKTVPVIVSSITDDEFGGFRITIPPLYRWPGLTAAFLLSSVILWIGVRTLDVKLLIFAIPATLFIAYSLINTLAIRRIIMIDGKNLAIRTEIAGFTRTKTFELAQIRNLRPIVYSHARGSPEGPNLANSVVFDYGRKLHRFGTGLSEEEVLRMVKTIRDRFRIKDHVDDVEPLPVVR